MSNQLYNRMGITRRTKEIHIAKIKPIDEVKKGGVENVYSAKRHVEQPVDLGSTIVDALQEMLENEKSVICHRCEPGFEHSKDQGRIPDAETEDQREATHLS